MQIKFQIIFLVFYLGVNNIITLPANQGREGFVRLRALSLNVNFKSGFELNCEIVFPESYLFEAVFYQDFVSAGRMSKGNKNYFTFMKSLKIFGKIIFCKRLPQVNKKVR